jgi:aspartyl-tRNA(Asn)/glutamyl-tRNA(Gln) amidotransferase subunit A
MTDLSSLADLSRLGAHELARGYADGSISPVEATAAALEAIDHLDPAVHAFVLVDEQRASEQARASQARWRSGSPLSPWDGIPTSVKDMFRTRDWPTLRGSTLVDPAGPWPDDAPCVARLREAGAVLLGKTATPEFGWKGVTDSPLHGPTGNPWNPDLTAGGSSGGSAAAIALGMGPWSMGTDGGGSVRIPAAFTGTVALKPTYGLIPVYPASAFGTLSHAGPMARSVLDVVGLLDVVARFDERDWSAAPSPTRPFLDDLDGGVQGQRIAFSPDLGYVRNDPEVDALVRAAAEVFTQLGAHVEELDPGFDDPVEAFHVLWFAGAAKVVDDFGPQAADRVDPGLRQVVELGRSLTAADYLDATAARMDLGLRMGRFHGRHDVLLTPTLPIPAFATGRDTPDASTSAGWTSWTPYTYPFNMTQQPALSVPCGTTRAGLPVGLQIVGPRFGDLAVLRAGRAFEKATPGLRAMPALATADAPPAERL